VYGIDMEVTSDNIYIMGFDGEIYACDLDSYNIDAMWRLRVYIPE